jgi:hypothetical protein
VTAPEPDGRGRSNRLSAGRLALERVRELDDSERSFVVAWLVFNNPSSVEKALQALEFNSMCLGEASQLGPAPSPAMPDEHTGVRFTPP